MSESSIHTEAPRRPGSACPTVLVVDDEPDIRLLIGMWLTREGFVVREAGDGIAALEAVATAPPDLIVTDLMMPRMGGEELIARVRALHGAAIPIISVSTRPAPPPGVDRALRKPFDGDELVAEVRRLLRGSAA